MSVRFGMEKVAYFVGIKSHVFAEPDVRNAILASAREKPRSVHAEQLGNTLRIDKRLVRRYVGRISFSRVEQFVGCPTSYEDVIDRDSDYPEISRQKKDGTIGAHDTSPVTNNRAQL